MDPVLAEIYSTVLGAVPYVIIAYALIFLILMAYVVMTTSRLSKAERKLAALQEHLDRADGSVR